MKNRDLTRWILLPLTAMLVMACSPQASNPTPTVDIIGTTAAELASLMLTQTASANTPTLAPPTETPFPLFTETPTLEPLPMATSIPQISGNTACYAGPGSEYGLVSNITDTELVEVVGIAHIPGWFVIRNPIYGSLCWVSAGNLRLEADFDQSALPTIYP